MTPPREYQPDIAAASAPKRPAYDPNNLGPEDEEARKYDDTSEGIDWDDIIATTQDDFLAGRFCYNSADYATHEEAMAALKAWIHGIVEDVDRELASEPGVPSIPARDPTG
jgi:hypothetical protein